jgi:hypothetical protein
MRMALWELLFMMVVLKIPIVYLCVVVWWAVRAEPRPLEGAGRTAPLPRSGPRPWSFRSTPRRRRPGGPHGSPVRSHRRRGTAFASARARS